jgi:hypothetical protein
MAARIIQIGSDRNANVAETRHGFAEAHPVQALDWYRRSAGLALLALSRAARYMIGTKPAAIATFGGS